MLLTFVALAVAQAPPVRPGALADQLAGARAIASYELTTWRKAHPKADLSITFVRDDITPAQANLVRSRLGYKNPMPVLDAHVLTIVFDSASRTTAKRLGMEAFVFFGSQPVGFHARYLIRTDGKEPRVLSRTLLQRYDLTPIPPPKRPIT